MNSHNDSFMDDTQQTLHLTDNSSSFNGCLDFVVVEDLDECKLGEDDCDHICENNPMGGYRCQCDRGYELSSDNRTCQGKITK